MINSFLKTDQRGNFIVSLLLYLAIFSLIGFGLYNIYKLNSKLDSIESSVNKPSTAPIPSPTDNISQDWPEITFDTLNLTLKYPQGWAASEEKKHITQFTSPDGTIKDTQRVYNLISLSTHTGILIPGFYDTELFSKIYNLKEDELFIPEILNSDETQIQKLTSGITISGERYVIFTSSAKNKSQETKAFILRGTEIIIFDLIQSDNLGLTTLKEMLRTAQIF